MALFVTTLAFFALAIASVAMIAKELCRPIVVASKGYHA